MPYGGKTSEEGEVSARGCCQSSARYLNMSDLHGLASGGDEVVLYGSSSHRVPGPRKIEGVVKRRLEKCKRQYLQETLEIIITVKSLLFKFQRCD